MYFSPEWTPFVKAIGLAAAAVNSGLSLVFY